MAESLATPLATYTTTVEDFVLGTGVLGLPYAAAKAGILASASALLLCAFISILTCSWLLEVGDRANAVQNELSRLQGQRTVRHADGGQSVLPPASAFVRSSTGLAEPLLEKSGEDRRVPRGVPPMAHRLLAGRHLVAGAEAAAIPGSVYQQGVYRELLPLQLAPSLPSFSWFDDAADSPDAEEGIDRDNSYELVRRHTTEERLTRSEHVTTQNSEQSAPPARRARRPRKLRRQPSFSADLAAALPTSPPAGAARRRRRWRRRLLAAGRGEAALGKATDRGAGAPADGAAAP